jgi:hypothetical protein
MLKYRCSLPSFLRVVARRNITGAHYPQNAAVRHGQGLHYSHFRRQRLAAHQANQCDTLRLNADPCVNPLSRVNV